eukprot:6182370-Pleurochrysis_carterae.AAC.5
MELLNVTDRSELRQNACDLVAEQRAGARRPTKPLRCAIVLDAAILHLSAWLAELPMPRPKEKERKEGGSRGARGSGLRSRVRGAILERLRGSEETSDEPSSHDQAQICTILQPELLSIDSVMLA